MYAVYEAARRFCTLIDKNHPVSEVRLEEAILAPSASDITKRTLGLHASNFRPSYLPLVFAAIYLFGCFC